MKTLSKVLSMLLVIVMCVSLFGANAYASGLAPLNSGSQGGLAPLAPITESDNSSDNNDDYDNNDFVSGSTLAPLGGIGDVTTQSVDGSQLQPIETDPGIMPLSGDNIVAKVTGLGGYESLEAAIEAAIKNGKSSVVLVTDYELTEQCEVSRNMTIDLGGNELTVGTGALLIGANVTLKNGTVTHNSGSIANVLTKGVLSIYDINGGEPTFDGTGKVAIYSGEFANDPGKYVASGCAYVDGKVGPKAETYVAILKSSGKGYTDAAQAFKDAKSTDTITFPEKDTSGDIDIPDLVTINNASLTLNLGTNYINFNGGLTIGNNASLIVNGNGFDGEVTLSGNSRLTLGCSYVDGKITTTGNDTITVNGSEIRAADGIDLANSTLNMKSGTISKINVSSKSTLNVSGGYVNGLSVTDGVAAIRAISGGEWSGVENLTFFDASIKDGLKRNEESEPYTVGKGSGVVTPTPTPGPGQTTGNFKVYNGRYVKGSNVSVYITESTGAQLDGLWIGPYYMNTSNTTDITAHTGYAYYSPIYIDNDYLDSLNAGTYYLYTNYTSVPNDPKYVGQLTILNSNGGGTNIPDYNGPLSVNTRYENDWYQGDDPLQFYVDPFPGSGKDWTNMKVYIDGREVGNLDYYDYHNGYFYLGTSKLSSIGSGTHWLTVENIKTGETGSCTFYVGPTLRARDTNKHVTGSSKDLKFVCSEPISRVWVGDKELDNYDSYDYYTLSRDGKTVTLTARFLNNRTAGNTYTLTVETNTGERVSTSFQILTTAQASSSPKTGDNSNLALWISALVMSGAAAAVIIPSMKKKENEG